MATLTISFIPTSPAPINGYRVRYRVKGSSSAYTQMVPNATSSPVTITGLDNVEYEGAIDADCGSGTFSSPVLFQTCTCPTGYTMNVDNSYCYNLSTVAATPPSGGTPQNSVAATGISYGTCGTFIYSSYNLNGTGTSSQIPVGNVFWRNGGTCVDNNTTDGPLNRTGLWALSAGVNQDIGFSICLTLPATKVYYIGMGCDNYGTIRLDGQTIIQQDEAALGIQYGVGTLATFKIWHVYPITIPAGSHTLELVGHNVSAGASFGAELYNATSADLIAATSYVDLGAKLIFSTKDYIGQPLQIGSAGVGYVCPSGYALQNCNLPITCIKLLKYNC
jgi:hypothetical protein